MSPVSMVVAVPLCGASIWVRLKLWVTAKSPEPAKLDPGTLDLRAPLVHRRDGDFPVAYTKTYGKGRVFYSTLGHPPELWDEPWLQKMYFEALRWAMEPVHSEQLHHVVR